MLDDGSHWPTVVVMGTTLLSVAITLWLHRLRVHAALAWLIGGTVPAAVIVVVTFYLESQQPYGPFWALVGIFFGGAALVFGFPASAIAAILSTRLRDDSADAD